MIRLYHGTSSKRASKIVGGSRDTQEGYRTNKYDCIFFAEDLETAKFFGSEKTHDSAATAITTGNDEHIPKYFTVIEFTIPKEVEKELLISEEHRKPLGEFTAMSFPDIAGGTGHERILIGNDTITLFNSYLASGVIAVRRLKFERLGECASFF